MADPSTSSAMNSAASTPGATAPSTSPPKKGMGTMVVVVLVVVILVVAGGLGYYYLVVKKNNSSTGTGLNASLEMGGFADGQIVTFVYNGTTTEECTPSLATMFPNDPNATAAAAKTGCEVGNADQNAVSQVPQYILVPAFAGLSIFGVPALKATSHGFPTVNGSTVLTQCGAGGTSTACPDHPTYLYSPDFTAVERHIGMDSGYGGLSPGVLPTPAHDHLLNTPTTYPNVYWGITVVLVFDPNIYPAQSSPTCTASVHSNLSNPTGNCLTSYSALQSAMGPGGCSSAAAAFNNATANPIWQTLNAGCRQVVVPGGNLGELNGNLYIPFSVMPGAPPMFPS
jgi:flagellar basal body-associated protein FliL